MEALWCVSQLEIRASAAGRGRLFAGDLSVALTGTQKWDGEPAAAGRLVLKVWLNKWLCCIGVGWGLTFVCLGWLFLFPLRLAFMMTKALACFPVDLLGSPFPPYLGEHSAPLCVFWAMSVSAVVLLLTWRTVHVVWIILDVPSVIADFTVLPASLCSRVPSPEPLGCLLTRPQWAGSVFVSVLQEAVRDSVCLPQVCFCLLESPRVSLSAFFSDF